MYQTEMTENNKNNFECANFTINNGVEQQNDQLKAGNFLKY